MKDILPMYFGEIVFSSKNSTISMRIARLVKKGQLRKVAPRIYSSNFTHSPKTIISKNIFTILGQLYPRSLLSYRSALELKPTSAGHIFLTYTYTKKIKLPGITLRFIKGPAPMKGDKILSGQLYVSQLGRALLENMKASLQKGAECKIIPQAKLEKRLIQVMRAEGEDGLNKLRNRSNTIANKLGMRAEFKKLIKLIGAN